jgi:hypothetical protein
MSEKPEWFEMAAEDPTPTEPKLKSKKRIVKIAMLTAPLLLVGGAMVFAEGDDSDDVPKMDATIPTATVNNSTNSANSANSTSVVKTASTSNTQNISSNTKTNSNVGVVNPATSNSGTGVGVPKPTGRSDVEGREGHEGRERPHGEGHEGGEHEFGGDDD